MQERGPSLRVLVITCKVHMWHTHGVRETSCPSKRERMNYIVQSILGLVELLNIKELLHCNWKFCIPPNAMWLCFMFCICLIRTQDFVVEIQLWNELWFTTPCTCLSWGIYSCWSHSSILNWCFFQPIIQFDGFWSLLGTSPHHVGFLQSDVWS